MGNSQIKKSTKRVKKPTDHPQSTTQLKEQIAQLKADLLREREKLAAWYDIAEEGLFIHENFIIQEVNAALVEITGYSKKELIGKHGKMLITKESFQKLQAHLSTQADLSSPIELEMIRKDGEVIIISTKGKAIRVGDKVHRVVIVNNITDVKKTQEELKDSEEKHRLVSSLLSDYVYICKIKPNETPAIIWVSGALEKIIGYTPEEIDKLEYGWFTLIHPEDVGMIQQSAAQNYTENKFYTNEYRIRDKEGNIHWLHDKSMLVGVDEATQELTLLGASKEITDRKKIEEDLRQRNTEFEKLNQELVLSNEELSKLNERLGESENKYRNLVENSTIGVGISKDEQMLFANQSLLDIFGVSSMEEFASKNLTDYMPDSSKVMVKERLLNYERGVPQENIFRHEIIRGDGKVRTIQVVSDEIFYEGKKCRQAIITDITAQQETENALLQASNIFKNIQIGLFIYRLEDLDDDRSLKMIRANPASIELVGLSEDQMVGKYIDDIFPYLRKNKIPQQYAEVVRLQIPISFDDVYYENNQTAPAFFSVKVFPLPDQCVGISFENVSERRKAERDLRTRNQELNNFVYKVSHDIRAPLSSIKGLINLSKLERLNYNYLPKIEDRVDHLDGFIRDILSHSRNLNTAVVIEQIDLHRLVEDWMGQLDYMNVSKEIKKEIDIDGEEFFSDETRVSEIVRNLISNAIKYSDPEKKDKYIKVSGKVSSDKAILRFEDNGIGIKENYLEEIFKMFYRGTEEADGSGIGLYIVKQALEKINGTIQVESTHLSGTTFTLEIPNHKAAQQESLG